MLAVQVQLNFNSAYAIMLATTKMYFHLSLIYLKKDTVMEVEMNEANL